MDTEEITVTFTDNEDTVTVSFNEAARGPAGPAGEGGGASAFADLTDKATAEIPTINTPLANALSAKAPIASPTFTGSVSMQSMAVVGVAGAGHVVSAQFEDAGADSVSTVIVDPGATNLGTTRILANSLTADRTWDMPDASGKFALTARADGVPDALASGVTIQSPTLVTPALGTVASGNFSSGTFTWPTFNQSTTGTASGLKPATDSTTAVRAFKADGSTAVLTVDTTNSRLGIGGTPSAALDIRINSTSLKDSIYAINASATHGTNLITGQDTVSKNLFFGYYGSGESTFASLIPNTAYVGCGSGASRFAINTVSTQPIVFCTDNWTERVRVAATTGVVTMASTTASTSTTTGALVVSGGVGVAGNINTGGTLSVTGASTLSTLTFSPAASATPASNGQLTFEATSNTSLTIKLKGTDGTVRSVVLTLA